MMTDVAQLAEQHIREYQARLKHLDELLEQTLQRGGEGAAAAYQALKSDEQWREAMIEQSGPMGLWDALAQQLEKAIEKLERR